MSKEREINITSPIVNDPGMKKVKESLIKISQIDKQEDFRVESLEYIDEKTTDSDDEFFYNMMDYIRFLHPSSDSIAYTDPYHLVWMNMPGEIGKNLRGWLFIYEHECLHQMWDTFEVGDRLKAKYGKFTKDDHYLLNIASDCVINDFLNYYRKLPFPSPNLITPKYLKDKYNVEYDRDEDTQYSLFIKLKDNISENDLKNDPNLQQAQGQDGNSGQSGKTGNSGNSGDGGDSNPQGGGESGNSGNSGKSGNSGNSSDGGNSNSNQQNNDPASNAADSAKSAQESADKAKDAAGKSGATSAQKDAAQDAQDAADKAKDAAERAGKAQKDGDMEKAKEAAQEAADAAADADLASQIAQGKSPSEIAQDAADKTKEAADKAQEAADKAQEAADNAEGDAKEGAQSAADKAKEAADKAKEAADKAQKAADNAKEAENNGDMKGAMKEAKNAQSAANEAKQAANNVNNKREKTNTSNIGWGNKKAFDKEDVFVDSDEELGEIKKKAEETIEKFKETISGALGKFIEQCQGSKKLDPSGLKQNIDKRGIGSAWNEELHTAVMAYAKKRIFNKKREFKRTYKRMPRRATITNYGDPLKKGKIVNNKALTINVAFYIDTSGSMGGKPIQNTVSTMYSICDALKKAFSREKVVDEIAFKIFSFDDYITEIPFGKNFGANNAGNVEFSVILEYIKEHTKDYLINIIITDAYYDINEKNTQKFLDQIDNMVITIVNNDAAGSATLTDIAKKNPLKFKHIVASGNFDIK